MDGSLHKATRYAGGRPHSLWVISLADVTRGIFQKDVPGRGRVKAGVIIHCYCQMPHFDNTDILRYDKVNVFVATIQEQT